jgi:uncharacterized membrane protein
MSEIAEKTSTGMKPNVAGLLCYLFGWISGLIFLLIEKESKFVRFHAIQSIAASVVFFVVYLILWFIPVIGWIINIFLAIGMFILWIMLMYKAYQGKKLKLPIVGNFAEKQAEQISQNPK